MTRDQFVPAVPRVLYVNVTSVIDWSIIPGQILVSRSLQQGCSVIADLNTGILLGNYHFARGLVFQII